MELTINGERRSVEDGATVLSLLEALELAHDDFVRISPERSYGSFMYSNVAPSTVWWAGNTRNEPRGT